MHVKWVKDACETKGSVSQRVKDNLLLWNNYFIVHEVLGPSVVVFFVCVFIFLPIN